MPWRSAALDFALGVPRNQCSAFTLLPMKTTIPLENEDESGRRLLDCCGTILQARAEGPRHHQSENILRYVQKAPDDFCLVIDKNEVDELMATKESALGPDGIPYSLNMCGEVWVRGFCFVRPNMCWKVVLFLNTSRKAELCLFPSPPISTTMEEL